LSFVWYINLDRSFYRFVTMHACEGQTDGQTDRRTDGQTEFSSLDRVCIVCSAVKTDNRTTSFCAVLTVILCRYEERPFTV